MEAELPASATTTGTAKSTLSRLLPKCSPAVFTRLRREKVFSAADLAELNKDELEEIGLSMAERCVVLRWAQQTTDSISGEHSFTLPPRDFSDLSTSNESVQDDDDEEAAHECPPYRRMQSGSTDTFVEAEDDPDQDPEVRRLDDVEQNHTFWCRMVLEASANAASMLASKTALLSGDMSDVRENILEELFDLTPERVRKVYDTVARNGMNAAELGEGLRVCGIVDFKESKLQQVFDKVSMQGLTVTPDEFEAVLSRLKLAQLLFVDADGQSHLNDAVGNAEALSFRSHKNHVLSYLDYNDSGARQPVQVTDRNLLQFYFGHRATTWSTSNDRLVRWVHLSSLEPTMLMSLTVKYSLHPLAVEDVLEQCPTKIARYGIHYVVTIERLCLAGPFNECSQTTRSGREKVQVVGNHLTIFCSGPPALDTVITVSQTDRSFALDWPGGVSKENTPTQNDLWATKLRQRFCKGRSRICERRADYLTYQIIDLCADELVAVTAAYVARLNFINDQLKRTSGVTSEPVLNEVSVSQLQLAVVIRRIHRLKRVLHRVINDPDFSSGLTSYLADVMDHLDEAQDDAQQMVQLCDSLSETFEHVLEKEQERQRLRAEKRAQRQHAILASQSQYVNKILYVLTVITTVFVPLHFLVGVEGMNFKYQPETHWHYGYLDFWVVVTIYVTVCFLLSVIVYRRIDIDPLPSKSKKADSKPTPSPSRNPLQQVMPELHHPLIGRGAVSVPDLNL